MNHLQQTALYLLTSSLAMMTSGTASTFDPSLYEKHARVFTPEESLAQFEVAEGYRLELVAAEPLINEPVLVTWDGNGRMYVAEMSRYMQDIDGKNQFDPVCQVVRLEDTNGDGRMDKRIVFADGLVLPRMVVCVDDWVIIRETNTLDLWGYRDTNGDGAADEKKLLFEGGKRGGNLEHQPSGLEWNIDNWMYVTYTNRRYRWMGDRIIAENLPSGTGQWGVTQDDEGRHFFSTAGGENPAHDFQHSLLYGKSSFPGEVAPGFREVFPMVHIPDVQGGAGRFRKGDLTLNMFTGCAGAHIFRGDRLPPDTVGDVFIPEPVGRLVRRAHRTLTQGMIQVSSATPPNTEFIRTPDANFRPVNAATGPDGCLYIVDMYRGIIQEGNWVRPGSYLRPVVAQYGLDKNVQRGRIYRVVHTSTVRDRHPRMLDASSEDLIAFLAHPNGWHRDNAQRLIVARQDMSTRDLLGSMVRTHENPLARLHALWTLDGLEAAESSLVAMALEDRDYRVRSAAIRISESPLLKGDLSLLTALTKRTEDPEPAVLVQLALSLGRCGLSESLPLLDALKARASDIPALRSALSHNAAKWEAAQKAATQNVVITVGKQHYDTLCATCHAPDGKGAPVPGQPGAFLAPSLVGSPRVTGNKSLLIRLVLKGMIGELDGKNYPGMMLPLESNDDAYLAHVLSYVRSSWGNDSDFVDPSEVAAVRAAYASRTTPYTVAEIMAEMPIPVNVMKTWNVTASHGQATGKHALDGNPGTRFETGVNQQKGMWLAFDMGREYTLRSLLLECKRSPDDYPRQFSLQVSTDGATWSEPIAQGKGRGPLTEITFPPITARHVKINQLGHVGNKYWSIHTMEVFGD